MILEALQQSPRGAPILKHVLGHPLAWTLWGCFPRREELQPACESSVIPSKPQVLEFGIHRESQL